MNSIFLSHYIAILLKEKNKWISPILSGTLLFLIVVILRSSLINFLSGAQIWALDLISPLLFIYMILNLVYSIFHKQAIVAVAGFTQIIPEVVIKVSPRRENFVENNSEATILTMRNYSSQVERPKPKIQRIKRNIPKNAENTGSNLLTENKIEEEAPPLEVNFESAEGLNEHEGEIYSNEYSGVVDKNFILKDSSVTESTTKMPEETTLFDKETRKKKFL
jgi:hypothetical protein